MLRRNPLKAKSNRSEFVTSFQVYAGGAHIKGNVCATHVILKESQALRMTCPVDFFTVSEALGRGAPRICRPTGPHYGFATSMAG